MILFPVNKNRELHFLFYLSIGLLNMPLTTGHYKIRLVGPTQCSGRVEVYHSNSWGTVCDDFWTMMNADVVCREVDCGPAVEATNGAFFGEGRGEIWLDDVRCTGKERSLRDCQQSELGENNCGHSEDAGVICSESIRLINGTNKCSGRVEVKHNGQWWKVCNSGWSKKETEVLCREIRCGVPDGDHGLISFGQGNGSIGITSSCSGNESSIAKCNLQERNDSCVDVSVVCSNHQIRLVDGTGRCSGRVEVSHNGQWGTVCDDHWGIEEAEVVCRETNCGNPLEVKTGAYFGEGSGMVWMDDLECTGNEQSLSNCVHNGYGSSNCGHGEDAGVICTDTARLMNGTKHCSGQLEVYRDGNWGTVCSSGWTMKEAAVVCEEIVCGKPLTITVNSNMGSVQGQRKYTSSCSGNISSISQCSFQLNPTGCEDVSLTCADLPAIRLVNGTDRCSGRVEVRHLHQWGTVCDDDWDIRDAQVVCRAMDCGTALRVKTQAFFGEGNGVIILDDVSCTGEETSLDECQHELLRSNCGHPEDAGVVCSSNIKLINGTDQCSGRVEVYHNGQWAPVYEQNWGLKEVSVVCREMNCGDPATAQGSSSFGQGSGARGYTVSCSGREGSVAQCSLREFPKTSHDGVGDATVVCSGNVRLVNGSGPCSGRVEFYNNGHWGTVCSDSWDMNDAAVVCRQLNCGRAHVATHLGYFGHGSGKVWIDQLVCHGTEKSLSHCPQRELGDNRCNHTSAAGVICTENMNVRLVGGKDDCSGRVEVRHADQWGTLCDRDWTKTNAEFVCKQLECGIAYTTHGGAHFGQGTGPVWEANDACFVSEQAFKQCTMKGFNRTDCGHEKDAGVICAGTVRLVNGLSNCSGRVEVLYSSQWGTVCDDEWGRDDTVVVCRQLGCGEPVRVITNGEFGRGTGPIWLDDVGCDGSETALTQCRHNDLGSNNCGHHEDVGVICSGALTKPQISLSPQSEVDWGMKVEFMCAINDVEPDGTFILEATAGSFRMEQYASTNMALFTIFKVDFNHTGSYRCLYRQRLEYGTIHYPQGDPVKLSVTVRLDQPRISLASSQPMVLFSQGKLEVSEGSNLSITCSVQSQFTGGFFYLTKSNSSTGPPKPGIGDSVLKAFFKFVADYKIPGEYTCVYGINVSTHSFFSIPSESLMVTMAASSVGSGVLIGLLLLLLLLLLLVVCYLVWKRREQSGSAMVWFSRRREEMPKENTVKGFRMLDEDSDYNSPANDGAKGIVVEEKCTHLDSPNGIESPMDLTGRVNFDFEPLINS